MGQTAEQDLQARLQTIRAIEGNNQASIDAATARNILHEELGRFEGDLTSYDLDQQTRDRLIAHTRQDAAHAVLSVGSLSKEVRALRGTIRILMVLVIALLALQLLSLFR